jgi:LacI family transcriptional regulator
LAKNVLDMAGDIGRNVPQDLAVMGIGDDHLLCLAPRPMLTSIAIPAERIGYLAAEVLCGALSGERATSLLVPPAAIVSRGSTAFVAGSDAAVHAALRFIRTHFTDKVNTLDIARHAGVARRTLEQRFRSVLGRSVHDELIRCRLERAKHLLVASRDPVKVIALESGYRSLEHFSRFFRKHTGVTPSSYRAQFSSAEAATPETSRRNT